jgi:hypothetical protein
VHDSSLPTVSQNGAVKAVAIANFVLGTFRIVASVLVLWYLFNTLSKGTAPNADIVAIIGLLVLVLVLPLLVVIAAVSIFAGIALIITGFGLLRRSQVSRVLTLVLGGLGGGLALLYGIQLYNELTQGPEAVGVAISLAGITVHGGYCALVFVVLLNRRNAQEFK